MHRRRQQRLVAVVMVLGLAVWFSASAVVPALQREWGISTTQAVWLTASVQLGFVLGALGSTFANLADRVHPTRLVSVSALAAGVLTAALALAAHGLLLAVPLRFLTGVALAGVYPVLMKVMASWAPPADRGRAFGVLIGALTLGSALPHLIDGLPGLPWRAVMLVAAAATLLAAGIAGQWLRTGPLLAPGRVVPHPRYAVAMFAERGPRLANLGYFGHMWELYALWTWLPTFLAAGAVAAGRPTGRAGAGLTAFAVIGLAGAAGCLLGGWVSDRFGRPVAAVAAMALSGSCCLLSPLAFGAGPWLAGALLAVWGASVIADSGVFSTALSETADPRYVGTALSAQTAIGFTLTVVTIQLVPLLAERTGWRWAFWLLAPGPLLGAVAMAALGARRPAPAAA